LMNDPDKWVRIECVEKLADWGAGNAKRAIQEMLKSTEDPDIRWSVEYAMAKLGE